MGLIISQANSIRFRTVNSDLPNFDNTLLADEKFYNDKIEEYCQRWLTTDSEPIIMQSDSDTVPTVIATKSDQSTETITAVLISSYDTDDDSVNDLFFFEAVVDFSLFTLETSISVTQGTDEYVSEPLIGDPDLSEELTNGESLKIEYYNQDNAFNIDFSTDTVYTIYVKSILKDYEFGGDNSTYDNQDELTKLKETVQRILSFKTLFIPRYIAETLKLASSMDNFVVNDISYVRADQPEITPVESSNFVEFSMALTDKEYLGTNSNDIGFNCDVAPTTAEMVVLTIENASGSETFTIPAGYLVHTLRSQWVSGTSVEIKLGTTVGGDELVYPRNINSVDTDRTTAIHGDIDRDADTDIYATVTGGVANLDLGLIQNKEA